jgi:hypothetical protein
MISSAVTSVIVVVLDPLAQTILFFTFICPRTLTGSILCLLVLRIRVVTSFCSVSCSDALIVKPAIFATVVTWVARALARLIVSYMLLVEIVAESVRPDEY